VQDAGRNENFDPAADRLTLAEVRQKIIEQSGVFGPADVVPVPCHPDCLAMAYALKLNGKVTPLTGQIDPAVFLSGDGNTIMYEQNPGVREAAFKLFANCCGAENGENHTPSPGTLGEGGGEGAVRAAEDRSTVEMHPNPLPAYPERGQAGQTTTSLKQLLCCLPQVSVPAHITYENVFRLIVMQFLDPHNFDVRSVKKACVQIVHPDGRIIPFDTYNLFYREGKSLPSAAGGVALTSLTVGSELPGARAAGRA
jgi:hypothetical protein